MKLSESKTAESNYRAAFERLKIGAPILLPVGTPVSQNNVAREADCDPSALRKSRFPDLIAEIQAYIESSTEAKAISSRQRMLKQRNKSRKARETIMDLRMQRDAAAGFLVDANSIIVTLHFKIRDLETRLEDAKTRYGGAGAAGIISIESGRRTTGPRPLEADGQQLLDPADLGRKDGH